MHKDGFKPVLSIIIPTVNQAALTVKCMASIRAWTKVPYEIVWVDNGSAPDQHMQIKRQATRPNVHTKLVKFKRNVGFVKATNAGLKEAEGSIVVFLNNDTEVSFRWDEKFLKALEDSTVGAVGPVTQSRIAWQEAGRLNQRWKLGLPLFAGDTKKYAQNLDSNFGHRYIESGPNPLSFFCAALRREVVNETGLLNENFGVGLGDDDEYCHRLRAAGYKLVVSLGTFVYHCHRTTFRALGLNVDEIRRHNLVVLKEATKNRLCNTK